MRDTLVMKPMQYDFDQHIDRRGTNALATDGYASYLLGESNALHSRDDLVPLWVADMQFATPPSVVQAMRERLEHPVFGYTANFDGTLFDAFRDWCAKNYGWEVKRDELEVSLGVIPALYSLVDLICAENDKVLTLTPAYGYFHKAVRHHGRELVSSPLLRDDEHYSIDFDDFARKASDPRVRLFFLCHPHNPTGRIWSDAELQQLVEICTANDIVVVSDEVHCDLLRSGLTHTPLGRLCPDNTNIVTCMAPSKTFNLAGLMTAMTIIPDPDLRASWRDHTNPFTNPLGMAAAIGAYRGGADWLDQLCSYLDRNFETLKAILRDRLPRARFAIPDATYLGWIDLSGYFDSDANLTRFFLEHAGVIIEGGEMFVDNGEGMVRVNVACPRDNLIKAINLMCDAVVADDC